ncbi:MULTISPECIES: primosomal protein N' [unclassified Halanaerobium]|uniref:replication restart helicase PriA n=1 Tax=unclassified Halanaerobium TaxID=2641197 RepID=UPI000DF219E0|nr:MULTISPECIES: primosomal protein N' [unclassified Halanaerobium]RCW51410.1 replication restart DNA helicase PriA [Halanaerobium sp. MA284_MarDTE_T2]RCW89199.1 replication restart DNA helicase PriA [Halanaerobium sp. DL-01]
MNSTVRVIVDIPIADLDRPFDYLLPEELEGEIKIGHLVKVPFGKRKISAFVVDINVKVEIDPKKLKKIDNKVYDESFFDRKMLNLYRWTAKYYHSYLIQVIKAALPPGVLDKRVRKKTVRYLRLTSKAKKKTEEIKKLKKRAPKQYLILKYFFENEENKITVKEAAQAAETYPKTVYSLLEKDLLEYYNIEVWRKPEIFKGDFLSDDFKLDKMQSEVFNEISKSIQQENQTFLYKEVLKEKRNILYFKLIEKLVEENKGGILLVPEIMMASKIVKKLKNIFNEKIAIIHSQLSAGEQFDEWRRIRSGQAFIAVGTRSAVFAPVKNLSLIIIDQEHDENYKQNEFPTYHARQVAARRVQDNNSVLFLSSPTPSIETEYLAAVNKYQKLMPDDEYINNSIPSAEIVDMKLESEKGNLSNFSTVLIENMKKTLSEKKQVFLFMNRRGFANYIICKKCGHVIKCDNCDITLTYHKEEKKLICHYCGKESKIPEKCSECGSEFIGVSGMGTEKIADEIREIFPDKMIARLDADVSDDKDKYNNILKKLKNKEIDILVGTRMAVKSEYYTNVGLIGIISADTILNIPEFRSAERTFQLLTQLLLIDQNYERKLVIQTFNPDHYSIKMAADFNYSDFYNIEINIRKKRNYPPFSRLVNIIIQGDNEKNVIHTSEKLDRFIDIHGSYDEKIGAAPAYLKKIRNKFRWQIILKFGSFRSREYLLRLIEKKFHKKSEVFDDVNIRIDVDPYKML